MTEQKANERLLQRESIYLNKYDNIKTIYAAVVKDIKDNKVTDDFVIEIGYKEGGITYDFASSDNHMTINNVFKKLDAGTKRELLNEKLKFKKIETVNYQQNPVEGIYEESIKKYKTLTGGISVFDEVLNTKSGTAGAFFKIEKCEDTFLISNYHVLIGDKGNIGDNIVHPSKSHTKYPVVIGQVFWKKFKDTSLVDAAVAKINYPVNIGQYTRCNNIKMLGLGKPMIGNKVKKCGKKTGLTCGEIRSVNCTVNASATNDDIFRNQILLTKLSENGDSGSVLVNDKNQVVGLIFSGDNTNVSFANDINVIFNLIAKDHPDFNFKKFV